MKHVFFSWLGQTDLKAMAGELGDGQLGPLAAVASQLAWNVDDVQVVILSDLRGGDVDKYPGWLKGQVRNANVELKKVKLPTPTHFESIHTNAVSVLRSVLKGAHKNTRLTFGTSSGTPVMAAVWIILAKTGFPARLLQSSKEAGVVQLEVPLEFSAELYADLRRDPDEDLRRLSEGLPPAAPEFDDILRKSAAMETLISRARRTAVNPLQLPILIEGESGTGKELLARAIHRASGREGKLIAVNCGAIPKDLVESELFGHVKGAFTDARTDKVGKVQAAHGGTLFLDEIGDLPREAQVRLLRVLDAKTIVRVGSTREEGVDIRVLAATNRDLPGMVGRQEFREDLFYRICGVRLTVPPLREREGDLFYLATQLLDRINEMMVVEDPDFEPRALSSGARSFIKSYSWPGNVRELQNALTSALAWAGGASLSARDIEEAIVPIPGDDAGKDAGPIGAGFDLRGSLEEREKGYLERAMRQAGGNKAKAARLLGFPSREAFDYRCRKHGLDRE